LEHVELERDLELERRKTREIQEAARERDKEYQKLKVCRIPLVTEYTPLYIYRRLQIQFDKLKRKTLFGPAAGNENNPIAPGNLNIAQNQFLDDQRQKARGQLSGLNPVDVVQVVGGMEAHRASLD